MLIACPAYPVRSKDADWILCEGGVFAALREGEEGVSVLPSLVAGGAGVKEKTSEGLFAERKGLEEGQPGRVWQRREMAGKGMEDIFGL